jgi:hypothetical protein
VQRDAARIAFLVLMTLGGLGACGCSSADRGGKVSGSVRLDGQPLADAEVSFVPKGQGAATNRAVTDAQGSFQVKPDKARRTLPPGTYNVFIRKYAQKDGKSPSPEERNLLLVSGKLRNIVPERYSSIASPQLTAEIKPGDNALAPFELKGH